MFDRVHSIPWDTLEHAYGVANDAPEWIFALASEVEDARIEAVCGFLHSSICHQYTTYSATPYVIPFVIEALRDKTLRERMAGGRTILPAEERQLKTMRF